MLNFMDMFYLPKIRCVIGGARPLVHVFPCVYLCTCSCGFGFVKIQVRGNSLEW